MQGGFRTKRSPEELVTTFSQSIKDGLDMSNIVGAVFVDFKGAYDTVWKTKLLYKLATKHISGKSFQSRTFKNNRVITNNISVILKPERSFYDDLFKRYRLHRLTK